MGEAGVNKNATLAYAHTRPNTITPETWDNLADHLYKTARHAAELASSFAPKAGYQVGLWHDVGKYRPEFQEYIRRSAEAGYREGSGHEHAIVGAYQAHLRNRPDLALAIAAHHGRLHSMMGFLAGDVERGAKINCPIPAEFMEFAAAEYPPADAQALWIRFLFSALVDADSLETELWDKGETRWRCASTIPELLEKLEHYIANELPKRSASPIDSLRREVQQRCRARATDPMGSFRLTVPTGGGKTLSSLLFALHHARQHNLRRVIVVIPYTSIIDQTASVFERIFGSDAVLEHHSNLDPEKENLVNRHCVENWDSPIIVTTSVQFFETLHANSKRDLRKLHSVAESVVVLDEVQTFPIPLIKPIKDVLHRLSKNLRVTTVHCSATQPLLVQPEASEIVSNPAALFEVTKTRVQVSWDVDLPTDWPPLAERIRNHPRKQVLTIVHTKQDAIDLANAVGDACIHLSTLLCPLHRRAVLTEIRSRLDKHEPCLVVSTQLVEAGVDIDFPVVFRALAGIESLAQAAGRCNREGRQTEAGDFRIFRAPSLPPSGTLRAGFKIIEKRLASLPDIFNIHEYPRYFKQLERREGPPSEIPEHEKNCNFPEVERLFKMIDDEGTPIIAPYGIGWRAAVNACRENPCNRTFRKLQPYTVSVRRKFFESLRASGYLEQLIAGSESSWVVFGNHTTLYSERFGFGGSGSEGLAELIG